MEPRRFGQSNKTSTTTIGWKPARTGKKTAWRLGAAFVFVWIWASVTSMGSLFHKWNDDDNPTDHAAAGRRVIRRSSSDDSGKPEFILWSQRETYFEDCRQTMLRNATWGAERAPLVDKIQAKHWAREWSRAVQIVPTLAIFDATNLSSLVAMDTLQHHLPQPFVVKAAHASGGVALVQNDTYQIVKHYGRIVAQTDPMPLSSNKERQRGGGGDAERYHQQLVNVSMMDSFSSVNGEMQYAYVPRRMLVERALDMSRFRDVTYWYMANGTPLYVSIECTMGDPDRRAWYSARFGALRMRLTSPGCTTGPPRRPHSWGKMRTTAVELARHVPGVVRVDLYADDTDVYFSEFTFTSAACRHNFTPWVADGLMYAALHGDEMWSELVDDDDDAVAEYVERTINGVSWVSVALDGLRLDPVLTSAHPSPLDMCSSSSGSKKKRRRTEKEGRTIDSPKCLEQARRVQEKPIRCIQFASKSGEVVESAGYAKHAMMFGAVMEGVSCDRAMILLGLILALTYFRVGVKPQSNQYRNNVLYLIGMATYLLFSTDNDGLFSPDHSLWDVARESYRAFTLVHPVSTWSSSSLSAHIMALSHFASYWFLLAAWRSRSLRSMLVWQLLYELVTAPLDEWAHYNLSTDVADEALSTKVFCMRRAFMSTVGHYCADEVIRYYVLPPFFVYGYLLPRYLLFFFSGGTTVVAG